MRTLLALVAVTVALAGCGGGESGPKGVVEDTADKLGEITSGELFMRLVLQPRGGDGMESIGFQLVGPFELPENDGELPTASVRYQQFAVGDDAQVGLVSTKEGAFVFVDDQPYELPAEREDELRAIGRIGGGGDDAEGGLADLDLAAWLREGRLGESGEEIDRVTGQVDVEAAVEDLLELAAKIGADVPDTLSDDDREQLAAAVRSSRFELETGADDRLLRWLHVDADFGLAVPTRFQGVLGRLVGAKVIFELGFREPNEPVEVHAPENALPYSALG